MRAEKFLTFVNKDAGNLRYTPKNNISGASRLVSNTFKGTLQSAINPNPGKEKKSYFIKYNPESDLYFLCDSEGYNESLAHMGKNFKWSFWLDSK